MDFLELEFMRRALLAGVLVGLAGPAVGVFVVQRGLSLLGDGIGHVVFAGVAAGLLLSVSPVLTALIFAVAGAVAIETLRQKGKASSDVALALVFYTGIAGAVLLIGLGDISMIKITPWLFGSVLTVGTADLWVISGVAVVALGTTVVLRRPLFAVAYDEQVARVSGLPVTGLNLLVAILAATTIAVTAKVVGVLLVASMLVLPVATTQQLTRSFRSTFYGSLAVGVAVTTAGLIIAFYADQRPAATIVLFAIGLFIAASLLQRTRIMRSRNA
jgi:zinc transport system permease protein